MSADFEIHQAEAAEQTSIAAWDAIAAGMNRGCARRRGEPAGASVTYTSMTRNPGPGRPRFSGVIDEVSARRFLARGVFLFLSYGVVVAMAGASGCGSGEADTGSPGQDASAGDDAPDTSQLPLPDASGDAPSPPADAQVDAGDGGSSGDAGTDAAASDAAAMDAGVDAGADSGMDGATDAGGDASSTDAASDGGSDAGAACDPVAQTGCPPSDKCTVSPPTCVPTGTVTTGGACGPVDDCVAGDLCTSDGTSEECREFCNTDSDCKQPAVASGSTPEPGNVGHCLITIPGTSYELCSIACNPVTAAGASGCAAGLGCIYSGATGVPELTDCETLGTGAEGAACTSTADCAAGLACLNNGTTSYCRTVCRSGTNADCTVAGDVCWPPGGVTNPMFGFCCSSTGC